MKFLTRSYIGLIFFLLYIPILVLIVFSFNESGSLAEFTGVSTVWYEELFHDEEAFSSLRNSLVLAICSSLIATVIGTFGALGPARTDRLRCGCGTQGTTYDVDQRCEDRSGSEG